MEDKSKEIISKHPEFYIVYCDAQIKYYKELIEDKKAGEKVPESEEHLLKCIKHYENEKIRTEAQVSRN